MQWEPLPSLLKWSNSNFQKEVGHKTKKWGTVLDSEYYLCMSIWLQCTDVILETGLSTEITATKIVLEWKCLESRQRPPVTQLVAVDGWNKTCMNSRGGVQQGRLVPCYQLCTVTQPTSLTHLSTRPHSSYCCQDTKGTCTLCSVLQVLRVQKWWAGRGKRWKYKQRAAIGDQAPWKMVTSWG